MSKKVYDLAVKIGTYKNRDGEEKAEYLNIGAIIEKDDGGRFMLMNRTFNPAGVPNPDNNKTFIVSMFSAEKKNEDKPAESSTPAGGTDNPFSDDDIPF